MEQPNLIIFSSALAPLERRKKKAKRVKKRIPLRRMSDRSFMINLLICKFLSVVPLFLRNGVYSDFHAMQPPDYPLG
jgi:hypothetical protein